MVQNAYKVSQGGPCTGWSTQRSILLVGHSCGALKINNYRPEHSDKSTGNTWRPAKILRTIQTRPTSSVGRIMVIWEHSGGKGTGDGQGQSTRNTSMQQLCHILPSRKTGSGAGLPMP